MIHKQADGFDQGADSEGGCEEQWFAIILILLYRLWKRITQMHKIAQYDCKSINAQVIGPVCNLCSQTILPLHTHCGRIKTK